MAWAGLYSVPAKGDLALQPPCSHKGSLAVATMEHCVVTRCAHNGVTLMATWLRAMSTAPAVPRILQGSS